MSEQDPTTRPTLETLLEMMREVRDEMRAGFASVNERLDRIERKIKILNDDVLSLRADLAGIDARVSRLEDSAA